MKKVKRVSSVKKSITLASHLDNFVVDRARQKARARGENIINYSAALADLILEARQSENTTP